MKKLKTIILTVLLTTGLIMPGCRNVTSCDGVVFQNYFDIFGITTFNFTEYNGFGEGTEIAPADTITFDQLDRIYVDFLVDYVVLAPSKQDWSFSLIPSANACSYIPGSRGSKEEALVNFSIITLNDFDDDHLANSNMNDLFDYHGSYMEVLAIPVSLPQFLSSQTGNIEQEDMVLRLRKAPFLNPELKLKLVMELSTGETFEEEIDPIIIQP